MARAKSSYKSENVAFSGFSQIPASLLNLRPGIRTRLVASPSTSDLSSRTRRRHEANRRRSRHHHTLPPPLSLSLSFSTWLRESPSTDCCSCRESGQTKAKKVIEKLTSTRVRFHIVRILIPVGRPVARAPIATSKSYGCTDGWTERETRRCLVAETSVF